MRILLYLSILLLSRPAGAQPADTAFCLSLPEAHRADCRAFHQAIADGRLLQPADSSASAFYQKLAGASLQPAKADTLKQRLTRACFGEAFNGLQRVVRAQMAPAWEELVARDSCGRYAALMERATEQLPGNYPGFITLQSQQRYLNGLDLRYRALRTSPPDTALLRKALQVQQTAAELNPDAAYLSNEMGVLFYALRDYGESARYFALAAEQDSAWSAPLIGLTACLAQTNEIEKALQAAGAAVDREPNFPETYLNLAKIAGRLGDPALTLNAVEKAVEKLAAAPVSDYTRLAVADILMTFDRYDRAEPLLKKILVHHPVLPVQLRLARLYDRSDRFQAADSEYRAIIARRPDHPEAYLQLGLIYHGLQRYATALTYYEAAYERAPEHPELNYNLGLIYDRFDRKAEAEELLLNALTFPAEMDGMIDAVDSIAGAFTAFSPPVSQLPEPEQYFRETPPFSRFDRPVNRFEDLIYLSLGDFYYLRNNLAAAAPMYQNAVLLNPGRPGAYLRLVDALQQTGQPQRAQVFIQLYEVYIPPTRENKAERQAIREMARKVRRDGARRLPGYRLDYYFYVLDNFWFYLDGQRPPELELTEDARRAGRRSIPRLLKDWPG